MFKFTILGWIAFLLFFTAFSQSLSSERVAKIKSATVQVLVDGGSSSGTGFFITQNGDLATCWHVIEPAEELHKQIFIKFNNGDTAEVKISKLFNNATNKIDAFGYDYCILSPISPLKRHTSFLKLGEFNNALEGEGVYTCGYPLGHPQQFISMGIISTKFKDDFAFSVNGKPKLYSRNAALLDLTLNRGNSGGAIVKIGNSMENDEVIGIADFVVNPLGNRADSIINANKNGIGLYRWDITDSVGNKSSSVDPSNLTVIFAQAIGDLSIGISGCISINYLRGMGLGIGKQ